MAIVAAAAATDEKAAAAVAIEAKATVASTLPSPGAARPVPSLIPPVCLYPVACGGDHNSYIYSVPPPSSFPPSLSIVFSAAS